MAYASITIFQQNGKKLVGIGGSIKTIKDARVPINFEPHKGDLIELDEGVVIRVREVKYTLDGEKMTIVASMLPMLFKELGDRVREGKGMFASGWETSSY